MADFEAFICRGCVTLTTRPFVLGKLEPKPACPTCSKPMLQVGPETIREMLEAQEKAKLP
jgi:hypothetical protein